MSNIFFTDDNTVWYEWMEKNEAVLCNVLTVCHAMVAWFTSIFMTANLDLFVVFSKGTTIGSDSIDDMLFTF